MSSIRSLASDTLVYGVSTILQRFLTFFLTPLYTNYLVKNELGDVINLYSYIAFVNVLYSFGFESAFIRFYRKQADNRFSVYTHSFISISLIAGVSTLILVVGANFFATLAGVESVHATTIIRICALIAFCDAVMLIPFSRLRMESRPKVFALMKLLIVVINVGMNLLLVVGFSQGAVGVVWAGLFSSAIGVLMFLPSILKNLRFVWDSVMMSDLTAFGLPTLPAGFSAVMLQVADRPILRALTDSSTLALYSVNYRLGIPMMLFVSVFEQAWKPFYLQRTSTPEGAESSKPIFARVLTYFTLICALIFLLSSLFTEYIVQLPFLGGKFTNPIYWSGLGIVPIIAGAYYFTGLGTHFAAGLHITKRTTYLPIAVGSAALANVVLNFALIPFIGYVGSAYATLGAYCISSLVMYRYSQRVYPIHYEWGRVLLVIGITLGVYFGFQILQSQIPETIAEHGLGIRFACIGIVLLLLWIARFFTAEERVQIVSIIRRTNR